MAKPPTAKDCHFICAPWRFYEVAYLLFPWFWVSIVHQSVWSCILGSLWRENGRKEQISRCSNWVSCAGLFVFSLSWNPPGITSQCLHLSYENKSKHVQTRLNPLKMKRGLKWPSGNSSWQVFCIKIWLSFLLLVLLFVFNQNVWTVGIVF
jgi:hypothetical protein